MIPDKIQLGIKDTITPSTSTLISLPDGEIS